MTYNTLNFVHCDNSDGILPFNLKQSLKYISCKFVRLPKDDGIGPIIFVLGNDLRQLLNKIRREFSRNLKASR